MVEGAHVESRGSVVIHGGVRGMSKGLVRADGDITLGFADQATLFCRNLYVKNALLHSHATVQGAVIVPQGDFLIVIY